MWRFYPGIYRFLQTGMVDKMPTLVVSGFTMLAAIQALFAGLILTTINQKNRQDFEMRLTDAEIEFKKLIQRV